ncbi:ATP-dependent DNA helicase [Ceratobasidium sp. AG-Ba]|nr:ATP-dependent DNA helicase [Ceratobasidium sp. AG-Ba]
MDDEPLPSRSPSPRLPRLPALERQAGGQLKEIDQALPESVDMSLGEWYETWLNLHEQGSLKERDVFALTGHFVDPRTQEPRRARLDIKDHVLPDDYVIDQHCDIDSIIGAPLENLPLEEHATLKYFPLPSHFHTLSSSLHIPPINYTDEHGEVQRAHLHKIVNTRFAEVGDVLIRVFFPRIEASQCSGNMPKDEFMCKWYDSAVMPMAMRHILEGLRVGWPAKYPNEVWRAENHRVSEGGDEQATGARQQTAREVHGRYVPAWIEGIREVVDTTPVLPGARGFFFGFELRGSKATEGSAHPSPDEVLVDRDGDLVYEGTDRTQAIARMLTGFNMAAIHRSHEQWYVDVGTNITVRRRHHEHAGSTFAFNLMFAYILNWATGADLGQCYAWVNGEGGVFEIDDAAHLGCMAGFRFTHPDGEALGLFYIQLYFSFKHLAYNLSLPKKVKQTSPLLILKDWDKERSRFFLPMLEAIKDSARTHGVVFRIESRVSWANYTQVHLTIPEEVVRPWLLYVPNSVFWGWMYARLMSILNVISQWVASRDRFVRESIPETTSLLILLCWMANALLRRPDEGSNWDEVRDAGSVHAIEDGVITPVRPLIQYYLHSLHIVQGQMPRISSLRTISIRTILYLFSRPGKPMDHTSLYTLIVKGEPAAPVPSAPINDPWGNDEDGNRPVALQQRTNNRQPMVNSISAEEVPDQFVGLIAEPERMRYPSEERDHEQREAAPRWTQVLTDIIYDYPIQMFEKAPNRQNASWCSLDQQELRNVSFDTFCSIRHLEHAFPSHYNFGKDAKRWSAAVAMLFPAIAESGPKVQNVSKLGARERFVGLLQSFPEQEQQAIVSCARAHVTLLTRRSSSSSTYHLSRTEVDMPLLAFAQCLLPFFEQASLDTESAFLLQPWTSPVWRENLGLVPLPPKGDGVDEASYQKQVRDLLCRGFVLREDVYKTIMKKHSKDVTPIAAQTADLFMAHALSLVKNALAAKGTAKDAWKPALLSPMFDSYKKFIIGLIKRSNGAWNIVVEAMEFSRVLPAHVWMDARSESREGQASAGSAGQDVAVPPPGRYIEGMTVKSEVARNVFGPQAITPASGNMRPAYDVPVACLLGRVYEAKRGSLRTLISKSKAAMEEFDQAFACASQTADPSHVKKATRKLDEWRAIATSTLETEDEPFQNRIKDFDNLWKNLGFVDSPTDDESEEPKVKRKKAAACSASILPTGEQMYEARQHYLETMAQYDRDEHTLENILRDPEADPDSPELRISLCEDEEEMGVERFKSWETSQAWSYLGLPNSSSFPFAREEIPNSDPTKAPQRLTPMWHQIIGTIVMLLRVFVRSELEKPMPSMLCDEVGLGKTLQIIMTICMLVHLRERQQSPEGRWIPPFIEETGATYFAGLERIPNLPFLVMVPHALSQQWIDQIRKFTELGAFSVLLFSTSQGDLERYLQAPEGEYRQAIGPNGCNAYRTIIVAELSAIQKEAKRYFKAPSTSQSRAQKLIVAEGSPSMIEHKRDASRSIFGLKFITAFVDEIHDLRNMNLMSMGVLVTMDNALMRVGATATPIYTRPADVAAQARILRHPLMIGENGVAAFEKMQQSSAARARECEKLAPDELLRRMRQEGMTVEAEGMQSKSEAMRKYQVLALRASYIANESVIIIRQALRPVMIRRTRRSRGPDGQLIMPLPPMTKLIAWAPMTKEEVAVAENLGAEQDKSINSAVRRASARVVFEKFLIEQRHAGFQKDIILLRKREKEEELPPLSLTSKIGDDWNAENLLEKASTCVLMVKVIVEHYLTSHNPKAILVLEDGSRDEEGERRMPDPAPSDCPQKVVVVVGYMLHMLILRNLFRVMGVKYAVLHGALSTTARNKSLDTFENNKAVRVLIMTMVGGTGLNLTMSAVMIFASKFWSGPQMAQFIGRIDRLGQTRPTTIYDIVSPEGIDPVMSSYANSKAIMSDSFFNTRKRLHDMHRTVQDASLQAEQEDEDDDGPRGSAARAPRPTKVASRRSKARDDDEPAEEGSQPPAKRSRKTPSGRERKAPSAARVNKQAKSSSPAVTAPAAPAPAPAPAASAPAAHSAPTSHIPAAAAFTAPAAVLPSASAVSAAAAPALVTALAPAPALASQSSASDQAALPTCSGHSKRPRPKMRPVPNQSTVQQESDEIFNLAPKAANTAPGTVGTPFTLIPRPAANFAVPLLAADRAGFSTERKPGYHMSKLIPHTGSWGDDISLDSDFVPDSDSDPDSDSGPRSEGHELPSGASLQPWYRPKPKQLSSSAETAPLSSAAPSLPLRSSTPPHPSTSKLSSVKSSGLGSSSRARLQSSPLPAHQMLVEHAVLPTQDTPVFIPLVKLAPTRTAPSALAPRNFTSDTRESKGKSKEVNRPPAPVAFTRKAVVPPNPLVLARMAGNKRNGAHLDQMDQLNKSSARLRSQSPSDIIVPTGLSRSTASTLPRGR